MDKDDSEDINGAKIAAQILSRMNRATQERLRRQIEERAPEISVKIEANMFRFDDIADLHGPGVQVLVQNISHQDLVLSLKTASSKVKAKFLENISQRKQQMVEEDVDALGPQTVSEVEDAQRRILVKLDELRTAGLIRSEAKNDVWV